MGHDAENQEDAGECEGEETVGGGGSSSLITEEEMLNHLEIVGGAVAGRNDHDSLAYLYKLREFHSTTGI